MFPLPLTLTEHHTLLGSSVFILYKVLVVRLCWCNTVVSVGVTNHHLVSTAAKWTLGNVSFFVSSCINPSRHGLFNTNYPQLLFTNAGCYCDPAVIGFALMWVFHKRMLMSTHTPVQQTRDVRSSCSLFGSRSASQYVTTHAMQSFLCHNSE